jgi:hypothetical protein
MEDHEEMQLHEEKLRPSGWDEESRCAPKAWRTWSSPRRATSRKLRRIAINSRKETNDLHVEVSLVCCSDKTIAKYKNTAVQQYSVVHSLAASQCTAVHRGALEKPYTTRTPSYYNRVQQL